MAARCKANARKLGICFRTFAFLEKLYVHFESNYRAARLRITRPFWSQSLRLPTPVLR